MTNRAPNLLGLPVEEAAYKIDLALQGGYTAYSAEILRLAPLGFVGCGFLLRASAALLALGAGSVVAAFCYVLWP